MTSSQSHSVVYLLKITKHQLRLSVLALAAVIGAGLSASGYWIQWQNQTGGYSDTSQLPALVTLPERRPLAKFTLVDDAGNVFDTQSLEDRWSFLFFGFMHCPDICPTTLQELSLVKREILAQGVPEQALQFVFISVDPERDKSDEIAQYVAYFDSGFEGVTGSIGQLTNLTRQLGAPFMLGESAGDDAYDVAHSSSVYLIDPDGQFAGLIRSPLIVEQVARQFTKLYRTAPKAAPQV